MVEANTRLTIGTIITMALFLSGAYYVSLDDDAYYCEAKDMVMICDKLSAGTGSRCYFQDTYKVCSAGWVKLDTGQIIGDEDPSPIYRAQWRCSPESCVRIN